MAMGLMTLIVLFMLIARLREDGAPARAEESRAGRAAPTSADAKLPAPTGPTDEDPDEAELAGDEMRGLSDGTTKIGEEEMVPYNRLVAWVKSQSFARLWTRGEKGLAYTYLYDDAPRQRGKLVALDVEIRLVRDAGATENGVPLHEAFATTKQSGNHLYWLVIVDFPAKVPVGVNIQKRAQFAGYFFKLQGFKPGMEQSGKLREEAPLLIGRIEWAANAASSDEGDWPQWNLAAAAIAIVLLILVLGVLWRWRTREPPPLHPGILPPSSDGVIPVEVWLKQCDEEKQGNPNETDQDATA
jgi:hypothetical protein